MENAENTDVQEKEEQVEDTESPGINLEKTVWLKRDPERELPRL